LAGKRLDPIVVAALLAVYARGEIKLQRFTIRRPIAAAAASAATATGATAAGAATTTPSPAASLPAPTTSIAAEAAELERTRV
jgi:hypothetical protein